MYCHKCGKAIPDNSVFCSNCGNRVKEETYEHVKSVPNKSNHHTENESSHTTPETVNTNSNANGQTEKNISSIFDSLSLTFGRIAAPILSLLSIAVPLLFILSLLTYPRVRAFLLLSAVIFVVWKYKKEPQKMVSGLGGIFICIVVVMLITSIFSGQFSSNKYIRAVKNGTLELYPQKTIGKAFDGYLEDSSWESGITENGQRIVNVTGEILYYDRPADILVQFVVDEDANNFEYYACEINGIPQDQFAASELFSVIFSEESVSMSAFTPKDISDKNKIVVGESHVIADVYGKLKITLDYITFDDTITNLLVGGYEHAEPGNVFLLAAFTIENVGNQEGSFAPYMTSILYDNSYKFEYYMDHGNFSNLAPLSAPVTGYVVYSVPDSVVASDRPLCLQYNNVTMTGESIISYEIRPDNTVEEPSPLINSGPIVLDFNGVSLTDWIGIYPGNLYDILDWPDYGTPVDGSLYEGGIYLGYDPGIIFVVNDEERINWISGTTAAITVNGSTLDKTRDQLVEILGVPENEESVYDDMNETTFYLMQYIIGETIVNIEMEDVDSIANRFTISPMPY